MITLNSNTDTKFSFDPDEHGNWKVIHAESGDTIGLFETDDDGMFTSADISPKYQRQGIATKVIGYLVEEYDVEFYFWKPDGLTYDDGRHLSQEGAEWASYLIDKKLAFWINDS